MTQCCAHGRCPYACDLHLLCISAEPCTDASEFLAECDTRRAWLTGFTGSAGCAVVTQNDARCWADGRYFLQAEKQLSSESVAPLAEQV